MNKYSRFLMHAIMCNLTLCNIPSVVAKEKTMEFDAMVLKNRGLNTALATYFADSSKFMPGRRSVNLHINGNDLGTVTARFGSQGELCVDVDFLTSAKLRIPSALADSKDSCYDYRQDYPSAVITPLPGEERLDLVVPEDALAFEDLPQINYQSGGTAALLNYDVFGSENNYRGDKENYYQASIEEGLNSRDWLLRSHQILTKNNGDINTNSLYTYVQHTFVEHKNLLQAGQINITNTLFAGSAITGIQIIPETALDNNSQSGVSVKGIAQGPQARVEVRQAGSLIYSTLVPMGPFTLNNVPITNVNTALDVTVKETDGSKNHFIIPAESLHPNLLGGPHGFSMAVGQIRGIDSNVDKPFLVTMSKGWRVSHGVNVSTGAMVATKYNSLAGSMDIAPVNSALLSVTMKASDDKYGNKSGFSSDLSASYSFPENITMTASASRHSSGYRELTDSLENEFVQYSDQYSTNIGWSNSVAGSFSLGYSLTRGYIANDDSRYLTLAWGKTFPRFSVSVNWQNQLNQPHDEDENQYCPTNNNQQIYVNISIPIGQQRVGSYWRKQGNSQNTGLQTSGSLNNETSYSITAERDLETQQNGFSGNLSKNLHYSQLGLSTSSSGQDNKQYSATLSGGILAHSRGVTLSPYKIDDTFALVSLGDKIGGVEMSSPAGEVWTDHWGYAVIPSMSAYRNNRVEINTETLPQNVDVNNGISNLVAGHGAVSQINFQVLNVRRAIVNLHGANRNKLPKGSTVVDANDNYVTTAVEDGQIFLADVENYSELYVIDDNGKHQCQLKYALPKERDLNVFYENITGVCQ